MSRNADRAAKKDEGDPRETPFISILLYVMGFLAALALLAFLAAWALHHR